MNARLTMQGVINFVVGAMLDNSSVFHRFYFSTPGRRVGQIYEEVLFNYTPHGRRVGRYLDAQARYYGGLFVNGRITPPDTSFEARCALDASRGACERNGDMLHPWPFTNKGKGPQGIIS